MMIKEVVSMVAAVLLSTATSFAGGSVSWLPLQTHLVLKLSQPSAESAADLASFREMMAFLTDSEELLAAIPAPWSENAQQVVIGQWFEGGQQRQIAILTGALRPFPTDLGHFVAAAVAPDVAIFGLPQAVAQCLQTRGNQVLMEELQDSIEKRFQEPPAGWVWMAAEWPALARPGPPWPSWTLRGALENVRSSTLLASRLGDGIRFQTTTDAGDAGVARFLSAELKEHLSTVGPGDDSAMQKALDGSTVRWDGNRIHLQLELASELLKQLSRSQNALQVFRWQLGGALRENRESLLDLASMLGLKEGGRVADVGAGRGFLAVRLARLVGEDGEVFAVDVSERALESIQQRTDFQAYPQLKPVLGAEDDPKLPEGELDAAIIINAYHEMPKHGEMLKGIWRSLRSGGRLLLLEPFSLETRTEPRDQQVERHHLAPELVESELREMGFEILQRVDDFVTPDDPASPQRNGLVLGRKP